MNESESIKDFGPYEALRVELKNLQRQFERAADRYHGLYHELIHPPGIALPRSVWAAFTDNNRAAEGEWERWDIFPSLTVCGRFHGKGSGVDEFLRLAESSYLLLRALKRFGTEHRPTPEGFRVILPSEDGHYGWLQLLYATAEADATALLRTKPVFWRHPESVPPEEIDDLVAQVRPASTDSSILVPAHPFVVSLQHDLFQSSVEAIGSWLDEFEPVTIADVHDNLPVWLPAPPDPVEELLEGLLSSTVQTAGTTEAESNLQADRPSSGHLVREFRFDGATWHLKFAAGTKIEEGTFTPTKEMNGFPLYRLLLDNPNADPGILELERKAGLAGSFVKEGGEKEPDVKIDPQGKEAIRKVVERIKREIDDTEDAEKKANLQEQLRELRDHRDTVLDKRGRPRSIGLKSEVARARMRIHRSLERARIKIKDGGMPEFARYLEITVDWEASGFIYLPSKYPTVS